MWRDGEGACPKREGGELGDPPAQFCWMRPDVLQDAWEPSPFAPYGIPGAFWWVLATATTVGYGDFYPTSAGGKLIGSACMVAGVLVMALPISIVGANFNKEYMSMMGHEQEELMEEARRQERAAIAQIERLYDLRTVALTDGAAAGAGPAGVAARRRRLDALADIDESVHSDALSASPARAVGALGDAKRALLDGGPAGDGLDGDVGVEMRSRRPSSASAGGGGPEGEVPESEEPRRPRRDRGPAHVVLPARRRGHDARPPPGASGGGGTRASALGCSPSRARTRRALAGALEGSKALAPAAAATLRAELSRLVAPLAEQNKTTSALGGRVAVAARASCPALSAAADQWNLPTPTGGARPTRRRCSAACPRARARRARGTSAARTARSACCSRSRRASARTRAARRRARPAAAEAGWLPISPTRHARNPRAPARRGRARGR